jgi:hypothetical protein
MASIQDIEEEHAAAQRYDQALELCIPYLVDTPTLLRVSLASHQHQAQIELHLQQQLPSVVKQAVLAVAQRLDRPGVARRQDQSSVRDALASLGWVLSSAGPAAVGTAAVAETLLRLSTNIPTLLSDQLPDLALKYGLHLTVQLVVDLFQQRVKISHTWIGALMRRQHQLLREQKQQQGAKQQDQQVNRSSGCGVFPRHFKWLWNALDKGQLGHQVS